MLSCWALFTYCTPGDIWNTNIYGTCICLLTYLNYMVKIWHSKHFCRHLTLDHRKRIVPAMWYYLWQDTMVLAFSEGRNTIAYVKILTLFNDMTYQFIDNFCEPNGTYRWLGARLQYMYLQCVSNGITAVLRKAIDICIYKLNACWFANGWCPISLRWRNNGRDSVSNHQPHDC